MCARFAYVSRGKLYLKSGDVPEVLHESPFVQGIRERGVELYRRHGRRRAWISRAALWGANANDLTLEQIVISARLRHKAGFLYSVFSREISGVLAHQQETGSELRLLHTADFRVTHVSSQPRTGKSP